MGHIEDFESDHLVFISTLPNFGHVGDVLGILSLLRDALKFIRCWDGAMVTTQPSKFDDTSSLRPWIPRKFLRWSCGQNRKEEQRVVSPRRSYRCACLPPRSSNPLDKYTRLRPYCSIGVGRVHTVNGRKQVATVRIAGVRDGMQFILEG